MHRQQNAADAEKVRALLRDYFDQRVLFYTVRDPEQLRDVDALVVSEGTIYPILSRLKRDGLVRTSLEESPEGPARKYYELTRRGEQLLGEMNGYWDVLTRGIVGLRRGAR